LLLAVTFDWDDSSFAFFPPPAITKANYLKNYLMFCPVFAETSIYVSPNYAILEDASA
jgi:hypothetical protein